jgi:predicted secreted protein
MEGTTTKLLLFLPELPVYSVALIPVCENSLLKRIYSVVGNSSSLPITFNIIDLACPEVAFIKTPAIIQKAKKKVLTGKGCPRITQVDEYPLALL